MDALSLLLEDVHLYGTRYYCLQGSGQWSYSLTRKNVILFYLVVAGGFYIEIDGEIREANKGDMVMISNTHNHVCYSFGYHGRDAQPIEHRLPTTDAQHIDINSLHDGDVVSSVLIECQYDKDLIRPLLSALPYTLPSHEFQKEGQFEILKSGIKFLTIESRQERLGKAAMINHLVSIVMIECLRTHIEGLPNVSNSWLMALKDQNLVKALLAMHDAPEENWTIHRLAEVAGMSRSSFAERFKQIVGTPPLTYLIDYRLRLAARYLRLQHNSISRIGEMVGYASDSTFSQAFKRVYGMSPRSYRQQFQHSKSPKVD